MKQIIKQVLREHRAVNIPAIIKRMVQHFKKRYNCETAYEINCGNCDLFAETLSNKIGGEVLSMYNFMDVDLYEDERVIKWYKVGKKYRFEEYGKLPEGINVKQLGVGYHEWVYHEGKHYDSETPLGEANMFMMPFFQRFIKVYFLQQETK